MQADQDNAAIDLVHLAKYTGGDEALNAEILQLFDGQARQLVDRLQTVLERGDDKTWLEIAHTLKGAARGIGAFGFADAAAAAERLHPSDRHGQARAAAAALENHLSHVRRFIANYPG